MKLIFNKRASDDEYEYDESNRDRVKKNKIKGGKGIKLIRAGGLSPVFQNNNAAPENKGVWAFIWPYHDLFLIGSTNDRGIVERSDSGEEGKSRIDQLKEEGWRKFVHKGELYSRLNVPGSKDVGNGWYKTAAKDLSDYMSKNYAEGIKELRQNGYVSKNIRIDPHSRPSGMVTFSRDAFEVFVPNPDEESF